MSGASDRGDVRSEATMDHGERLEWDALEAVARAQDSGLYEGRAPNWTIPSTIPSQRLSGLKRRGFLDSAAGEWWLTKKGCGRLDHFRASDITAREDRS